MSHYPMAVSPPHSVLFQDFSDLCQSLLIEGSFSTSSSITAFTIHQVSTSRHLYQKKKRRRKNLNIYPPVGRKDFSHGHWLSFQSSITGFISARLFLKMALCINHLQPAKRRKPGAHDSFFFFLSPVIKKSRLEGHGKRAASSSLVE